MGLNYYYGIYVRKECLKETLKYILQNATYIDPNIEYIDDKFYRTVKIGKEIEKHIIVNDGLGLRFTCGLKFDIDDRITEYLIFENSEWYNPSDFKGIYPLSQFKVDGTKYRIGNVDISVSLCREGIADLIEISLVAVTTDMSILFAESPSIESFFKNLCIHVKADYGYLCKEDKGYKLICFDGNICNLNVPNNPNNPLQKYGFISAMKDIIR